MSLESTAQSGDQLATLKGLRDQVARTLDATSSARDVSSLSKQLTDVLARIAEVEKAELKAGKGTKLDELAKRRARRTGTES